MVITRRVGGGAKVASPAIGSMVAVPRVIRLRSTAKPSSPPPAAAAGRAGPASGFATGLERRLFTHAERIWYALSFEPWKMGRGFLALPWGRSELESSSLLPGSSRSTSRRVASRLARRAAAVWSAFRPIGTSWNSPSCRSSWHLAQWSWRTGWTYWRNSWARLTAALGGRSKTTGRSLTPIRRAPRTMAGSSAAGRSSTTSPPAWRTSSSTGSRFALARRTSAWSSEPRMATACRCLGSSFRIRPRCPRASSRRPLVRHHWASFICSSGSSSGTRVHL